MNIWRALWRSLYRLWQLFPAGPAREAVRADMRDTARRLVR